MVVCLFLLLHWVYLCLYFADMLVTHFPCLKLQTNNSFCHLSFLYMYKHLKTKYFFHALKKKRMACSFSLHCATSFNLLVPVLMKQSHNIWRRRSNPRVQKQDPVFYAYPEKWNKHHGWQILTWKERWGNSHLLLSCSCKIILDSKAISHRVRQ